MPALYLEQFGIESPPAVVWTAEEEALQHDAERPAEEELDLDRWVAETTGGLARLVAEAEESRQLDLDRAIGELEELESEAGIVQGKVAKIRREAPIWRRLSVQKGLRDDARRMTFYANRAEHWLRSTEAVLPALRDARWQLMAIRAEREEPGDAPAFDDADSLIAHLNR